MTNARRSAVVFAYSDVGVRGLACVLASGIDVSLVVTHADNVAENIWFDSVAAQANLHGVDVITPANANTDAVVARIRDLAPDFIFSFYYRDLLGAALLDIPRLGAFNLHGSLLPRYRGRAPVNWAVLNGETETGVSLHRMVLKADAGALLDQQSVPILPNDTAIVVHRKVCAAADIVLMRALPQLRDGLAQETPLDVAHGSYFGRRTPEQGRIDWSQPAASIHNLIRAVAPPYPGAFFDVADARICITGSFYRGESAQGAAPRLYVQHGHIWADCRDGQRILLLQLLIDGVNVDADQFVARCGAQLLIPVVE
jgi:methionyl-tRNA formyltransferase